MKISLDVDGVLLDFDSAWRKRAGEVLGRKILKTSILYHLGDRHSLTTEEYEAVWASFNKDGWETVQPFEGVRETISQLHDLGVGISCITASPDSVALQRRDSLRHIGLHDKEIAFVGSHLDGNTKHAALKRFSPDMFIDDQLYNIQAAKESDIALRGWVDRGDEQIQIGSDVEWHTVATHRLEGLAGLVAIVEAQLQRASGLTLAW